MTDITTASHSAATRSYSSARGRAQGLPLLARLRAAVVSLYLPIFAQQPTLRLDACLRARLPVPCLVIPRCSAPGRWAMSPLLNLFLAAMPYMFVRAGN